MDWGPAQVPAHTQVQCTCPSLHYMPQPQPGGNARSALPPFILFKNLVATRFELGFYSISERTPQNLSSKCYHRHVKIDRNQQIKNKHISIFPFSISSIFLFFLFFLFFLHLIIFFLAKMLDFFIRTYNSYLF